MAAAVVVCALAAAIVSIMSTSQTVMGAFPGENGRIAFDSDRDGDFEIFRMKADGTGQRQLTHNDETDYGAAFSPDGKRIAFFSMRDGNGEIYVMRADGTRERNVSQNDASDNEPFFTPNGKKIVFQSDRRGASDDIFVMRLDGTHVRRLTEEGGGAPTVAADGRIAFVRDDELWIMRADGSRERALTTGHDDNYPTVSPNGKRIAFERRPPLDSPLGDDLEIFTRRIDGSHARPLTDNDDADFAPVFSPNGEKIAWDALGNVRVMRADGTHKRRLTLSASQDEYADWAPKP